MVLPSDSDFVDLERGEGHGQNQGQAYLSYDSENGEAGNPNYLYLGGAFSVEM